MHQNFGQIPRPNASAASRIAAAAANVEFSLKEIDLKSVPDFDYPQIPEIDMGKLQSSNTEEVIYDAETWPFREIDGQNDDVYEGASRGVVEHGIEYLAFYKSFRDMSRSPAPNKWGIFLIKRRCVALATDMRFATSHPFDNCLDALTAFLYTHELYHYKIDSHCLQMEATGGSALYRPYRRFLASRPVSEWHEESVANFYGLRALQPKKYFNYAQSLRDYLEDLVTCSPGAYAGGIEKRQNARKDQMAFQAAQLSFQSSSSAKKDLIASTFRLGANLTRPRDSTVGALMNLDHCPVHWIDWVQGGSSVIVPYVASVAEVNNDFIKRYLAGVIDHQSDHTFYRIDNGELVKVPNPHRADLTNPEFHNIIAKAGMTSPQFFKERQRTSIWKKGVPRQPHLPPRSSARGGQ